MTAMKKTLYSLFVLLMGAASFVACSPEVDDLFDQSSSERYQTTMKNTRDVLIAAPNGWRMEYYGTTSYGGYNVFMKFTEDSVTIASEQVGASQKAGLDENGNAITCTSHYEFEQSQGVVLTMNEYNELFHYFSDPANTDQGATQGDGFGGDFEFRVISACADSVILEGKKHQGNIKMYPMPTDMTWGQYIQKVEETDTYMASRSYQFDVDDRKDTVSVTTRFRQLYFTYYNNEGTIEQTLAPYIVTPDGYKFYKNITVKGIELSGFDKGTTDEYFFATGHNNVRIWTYVPTLAETLTEGMWFITYDDLGSYAQSYWDTLLEKLGKASADGTRNRLYWALLGTYNNRIGFHMQAGGDYTYQILTFDANDEGTEVTIKWSSSSNNKTGTNRNYYNRYGVKEAIEPFCKGSRGRTFTITADNNRKPTYLILTDKEEPTNVIKLWEDQKSYPFGDRDKEDK